MLTPSIPFCPLFHRLSVSLAPILSSSFASLLLLPRLPFYIQIHSPGCQTPLFPLFRKLSDALSRTTYMSTPSSPTEDFDSCLIHVSHTVTWDFLVCFPRGRTSHGISVCLHKEMSYKFIFKTKNFCTFFGYILPRIREILNDSCVTAISKQQ